MEPIIIRRTTGFTPSELFAVAADIEAYPEFLPNCVATRVTARDGNMQLVDNVFRWGPLPISFRTHATFDPPHSIDIRSVDSLLIGLALRWRFDACDGGTDVTFEMDLKLPVPGLDGLLANTARAQAQETEQAFLRRVSQRQSST